MHPYMEWFEWNLTLCAKDCSRRRFEYSACEAGTLFQKELRLMRSLIH